MSGGAVLILGAGSSIAKAIAHRFAEAGHALVLAGRSAEELERDVADVRLRYGVGAAARHFEATDYASHADFVQGCIRDAEAIAPGGRSLEGVVLCHGYIAPEDFLPVLTFQIWAMLIVGGSGSNYGAVVGTFVVAIYRVMRPQCPT